MKPFPDSLNFRTFLLLLLSVLITGCSSTTSRSGDAMVLDLPVLIELKGEIKTSDMFESIEFVALQPIPEWGFPEYHIDSRVFDHYILFNDMYKSPELIVYKRNGEFLLKLSKRGKGPGEYNAIEDFGMDPAEIKIWILEGYKSVLHWYNLQGNWLETINLGTDVSHVRILSDGNIIAQNTRWEVDGFDSMRLFLADPKGKLIRPLMHKPKDQPDYSNFQDPSWLFETKGVYYYRDNPNSDTVYKLNKKYEPEPFFAMDPGEHRIPADLLDAIDRSQEWQKYLRMDRIFLTGEDLFLSGYMNKWILLRVNLKTGQTICSNEITDDILGLRTFLESRSVHSDYIYRTIYVPYYKEHLNQLFINDNPSNKPLQDKLRKILAEAPDDLEMIVLLYKVK